jgi:putative cell wall-binding protein
MLPNHSFRASRGHRMVTAIAGLSLLAVMLPAVGLAANGVKREEASGPYNTSALLSRRHFKAGVPAVYIVNGSTGMAHALAAAPAAARIGAPILLVTRTTIPTSVRRELNRLDPARIIVVGNSTYVSGAVVAKLDDFTDGPVRREAASNLFDTSAVISRKHFNVGVPALYVANGSTGLAQALPAGAAAGRFHGPLLLIHRDGITDAVRRELNRLDPGRIIVLGSSAYVTNRIVSQLGNFTDGPVKREAGTSRYHTSAIVSRHHFRAGVRVAYVMNGSNGGLAQGMSVGASAGRLHAPILLVASNKIPGPVARELQRLDPSIILVVGGSSSVSAGVASALEAYVFNPPVAVNDDLGTLTAGCSGYALVLDNDSDPNDPRVRLQVTAVSDPAHGSATIVSTRRGSITAPRVVRYVANGGYTGPDSFTYTVEDPNGDTDHGTVSVDVAASSGNSDGDGLPDECDPFPQDASNETGAALPFTLSFDGGDGGLVDSGFGGLMTNSKSASLLDGDVEVTGSALVNHTVDAGDANHGLNTQRNALQANLNTPSGTFRIQGTACGPFPTEQGAGVGIFFGRGDQDNFIKAIVTWNASRGTWAVQDYREVNGGGAGIAKKADANIGSANCVTLYLTVNPATGMYSPSYSLDGGPRMGFGGDGSRRTVPNSWLSDTTIATGVIATSRGSSPAFEATWSGFHVGEL